MDVENDKFDHLFTDIKIGKVNIITGNNGTGKSRFFKSAAEKAIENSDFYNNHFQQVICLSGTHNDKFPRKIWQLNKSTSGVCYLGYKVGNNMISDIAPFRVIVNALLGESSIAQRSSDAIDFCLARLNIDPEIKLHLRYGKNRKERLIDVAPNELSINLRTFQDDDEDTLAIASALKQGDLSLQTISIKRGNNFYALADLSSGERSYMIALLGALYCAKNGSLIFFDEPENSLHPGWQKTILRDFRRTLDLNFISATMLVATHSPLIASSISNQEAFTCDFPSGQTWHQSDLYGKTSDNALKDQFSLYSSRSTVVIELAQKCLSYITKGDLRSPDLYQAIDTLLSFELVAEPGDPMREVMRTLEHLRAHHELP
ncbi:AAA family ATPase [Pseudomonas helleri]|uniref:AAA family ATPase n=1 Tax=Pseudomonas helleri TaxID=1608996 RepID=UPI003FD058FB